LCVLKETRKIEPSKVLGVGRAEGILLFTLVLDWENGVYNARGAVDSTTRGFREQQ